MKKKIERNVIVGTYVILNSGQSINAVKGMAKISFIKIIRAFRQTAEDFFSFRDEVFSKMKGENHEAINEKLKNKEPLSNEETAYLERYKNETEAAIKKYADEVIDVDFTPLTEEEFSMFADGTTIETKIIVDLYDLLVKK